MLFGDQNSSYNLINLSKFLKFVINYTAFYNKMSHIETYNFATNAKDVKKFQVSRRLNRIAQQVTLCLKWFMCCHGFSLNQGPN